MNVSVKSAVLNYTTRGHGPTCLILSAIGTRPYELQTPAPLVDRFRLAYVDVRGAGQSTGEPGELSFDVLAEDLEAVRRHLGVPRVAVLGHSILGALAVEYGRRRPETVSHVILAGTPPSGNMAALLARAASFFEEDATDERKRILKASMAALPSGASAAENMLAQTPMRFFDPRFDATSLYAEAIVRPQILAHVMGTLARGWDITTDSDALLVPLFIAHGRYDYTVPHVLWQDVMPQLHQATFQLFERSGHQPFFEEPERFTAAVTGWMALS